MGLCNQLWPASQPTVYCSKNFTIGHFTQSFQPVFFFTPAVLTGTIVFYHSIPLHWPWPWLGSQGQCTLFHLPGWNLIWFPSNSSMKTECDYLYGLLENGHIHKNLTQNGEPQRYSWEHGRRRRSSSSWASWYLFWVRFLEAREITAVLMSM